MPLPERVIHPVNISRGTLQCPVPDELEGVTNGTLANIIRQLSSLSRHAEEMFGNLFKDAENIANRSSNLQARIDRLSIRVTQLDSTVEEVSLQDIQLRKAYRSSQSFDQQVVSRETMPKAMLEAYLECDKPPPLDKLNPYREDGKDGLKFYTDPNYFFDLWRQEMVKDTERMMNDRGKKHPGRIQINGGPPTSSGQKTDRHKKRVRQPSNTMERQRLKAIGQGEYLMSPNSLNNDLMALGYYNNQDESFGSDGCGIEDLNSSYASDNRPRPNSIEIKRTYSSASSNNNYHHRHSNEPIYTPRVLRNEGASSPNYPDGSSNYSTYQQFRHQHDQHQASAERSKYGYGEYKRQDSAGLLVNQLQKQQQYQNEQHNFDYRRESTPPPSSSPNKKRPTQPPPAPPPGAISPTTTATPTRTGSALKDTSLPLPPPPLQQLIQEVASVVQNGGVRSETQQQTSPPKSQQQSNDADLPPPPPTPSNQTKTSTLSVNVPSSHLPPSPPPPPAPDSAETHSPKKEVSNNSGGAPPPPPPPPPSNGLINGDVLKNNASNKSPTKSSPVKNSSILSPPGLRKPQPLHRPPQDNVRSDLLKAIRDGIALKKVEQKAAAACDSAHEGAAGQTDVASILARRVAVEMSDSDDGPSDSECDSDDWGDESNA